MKTFRRTTQFASVHLLAAGLLLAGPGALCARLSADEPCPAASRSGACCCSLSAQVKCTRACCANRPAERPQAPPVEKPQKLQTAFDAVAGACGANVADSAAGRNVTPSSLPLSVSAASLTLHALGIRLQT